MNGFSNIHCPACLFSFDAIKYLILHLCEVSSFDDKLHRSTLYKCDNCTHKCYGSVNFCAHLENHHYDDDNDLQEESSIAKAPYKNVCKYCKKGFRKASDLERHIRVHTNLKPFRCTECGRCFRLKSTLKGHLKTHIPQSMSEVFPCSFCKKNFLSLSALKLHIRVHTNETPFTCEATCCNQSFRTKKLMITHFRNFHQSSNGRNRFVQGSMKISAPNARKQVLKSLKEISHLKEQPLITSQNSAFSQFQKSCVDGESISQGVNNASQVIVIRVQARSGSVVAGSSAGQTPTDIILEPLVLMNLSRNGYFMYIALKKTGLPLNLALSVDPGSVLSRLEFQSTSISHSVSHCFTSVVYPTMQHVVSNPPLPFSVLCSEEEDLRKIRGHMPSFLIECFLAGGHSGQYDSERRHVLAQSCLPMLCNEDGVQREPTDKNTQRFQFSGDIHE